MNTIGKHRRFSRNSLGTSPRAPFVLLLIALLTPGQAPRTEASSAGKLEAILRAEARRARGSEDLSLLGNALRDADPMVVRVAARALGRLERPSLGEQLLPLLGHDDPSVRRSATEGMAQALQGFRGDSSSDRRGLLWENAIAALRTRLREDRDSGVRAMAALSLGRLPYVSPREITEIRGELVSLCVETESPAERLGGFCRGAATLTRASSRRVRLSGEEIAGLRSVAGDRRREPGRRQSALRALLIAQAAGDSLLELTGADSDDELRRVSLSGVRIGERDPREPKLLSRGLADPVPAVRVEALRALGRFAGESECARLVEGTRDSVTIVALAAVDELRNCGDSPQAVQRLEALARGRERLRGGAPAWHGPAHALVSLAGPAPRRPARPIRTVTEATDWHLRMYAARAAEATHDSATLVHLAADRVPNVREAAVAGLRRTQSHGADAVYRSALGAADFQLVLTAAEALRGSSDKSSAAAALLGALDRISALHAETSRDTRRALLAGLREAGGASLAPRLTRYLSDFDPVIADTAAAILTAWTGERTAASPVRREGIAPVAWAEVEALRGTRLVVTLSGGKRVEADLLVEEAPLTAVRVARLVRQHYYDGLTFHRMAPNFVIQGGSPGANEYSGAPDFMPDELSDLSHERGTLGISTRGRDTGDAQLFVNLRDNPRLDYDYTVFARITEGLEVVDQVLEGEVIRRIELRQAESIGSADTAGLMATVRDLAADSMEGRRAGTPGGARARRYLLKRMTSLGLTPWRGRFEHPFSLRRDSAAGVNLLGVIPGQRRDLPYLVLSAHYDHEGVRNGQIYNGADDNASGVAAVLAIAASLKRRPLDHPVLVALFDAEEAGLLGARAFVADSASALRSLAFDLNLDMVSHSEEGVLWASGAAHLPELRPLLLEVAARAPISLKLGHDRRGVPGEQDWTASSDHGPFHAAGIPFLYLGVEDHKDYHKPTDDPETVTVGFFGKAVATVETVLRKIDARFRP